MNLNDLVTTEGGATSSPTFFSHVFSSTEEGKAEFLNVTQYALLGVVPVVLLNKLIQRFIPEADTEKSSLEILFEIFIQIILMFCGIVIIHRIITYIPTYSGFRYENLMLTNVILAFLILVLSIQTKLGLKVNILVDRINELWNGPSVDEKQAKAKNGVRTVGQPSNIPTHTPSRADYLDTAGVQSNVYPPAVAPPQRQMQPDFGAYMGPMAANSVLGGSFGASF